MAEQVFRTAMRTTDVLVTALFSPAAVVAIGLADLYARFPLRIGLGLGGGAIALSSQDTGAGAEATRDEAVAWALVLAFLTGIPFVLVGVFLGEAAIAVFGADQSVVDLGATYLLIIFATAPARLVGLVASRALQGTGDTRTPMYVNVLGNSLNIAGSVGLGLGLLGLPRLEVTGVALATASANVLIALLLVGALLLPGTEAGLIRPRNRIVARQLVVVSGPRTAEGFAAELAEFPFNALLLGFGEQVNAGFQIGRRIYQQVTGPLSRGYSVAASILVGQSLGEGKPDEARENGWAVAALGLLTVGGIGGLLFLAAPTVVRVFPGVGGEYAVGFTRAYGLAAPALVTFVALSGALQGASETRVPFAARLTGMFGFFLGLSYLLGELLGYGPLGAYIGIWSAFAWMALVVAVGFHRTGWAARAAGMMDERGSGAGVE
ncbi:MATE family efflux transporter [Natronomonas sp. EA1]|uniref:MATE family efflux transporter n=1 Tax=Natronomonas sp. EA1 TaxID=3421655 RepID=UPI003EBEEE8F